MKKKIFLFVAAAMSILSVTSCKSDDNDNSEIVDASFVNETLQVTYNGVPVIGKNAHLHFDKAQGGEGTLNVYSAIDMSAVASDNQTSSVLYGPGVLPGTPMLTIPVNVVKEGDNFYFATSGSTEYVDYELDGEINGSVLSLDFSNVSLKNKVLAGKSYKPAPLDVGHTAVTGSVYVNWESTAKFDIGFGAENGFPAQTFIASLVLNSAFIPMGNTQMSVYDIVKALLKNATFTADGNITGTYVDMATNQETAIPVGIAQYVAVSGNEIKLFLNPEMIIASAMGARSESGDQSYELDTTPLLAYAMETFLPMLSEGIPVEYKVENGMTSFYLPSSILLPLAKGPLYDLTSDPNFVPFVEESMKGMEGMADMMGMIRPAIASLPSVLEGTTLLELGLNLVDAE